MQLTWPHKDTDWSPYLEDITETFLQLSKAIAHYEPLVIAAKYPEEVREMLSDNLNEEEMNRVSIYECDNNDTWARDHAFITLIPADDESPTTETSDAESTACRLLDFRFNGWGEKFVADKDNLINRTLYSKGVFRGERADYDDFVLEGGSIESDGKGTVLTTSICLMAPHRNQPMTLEEVEQTLKERLCARKVVWLNHGQLIGDDTDGHIDTIVRVCPDNTLLYVGCDDEADPQYALSKASLDALEQLTDAKGRKIIVHKLPVPAVPVCITEEEVAGFDFVEGEDMREAGERLAASYVNFYFSNDSVVVPAFGGENAASDALAAEILAKLCPERKVVQIPARAILTGGGNIHCITQQIPKGVCL